jgi:hypothetical protein
MEVVLEIKEVAKLMVIFSPLCATIPHPWPLGPERANLLT